MTNETSMADAFKRIHKGATGKRTFELLDIFPYYGTGEGDVSEILINSKMASWKKATILRKFRNKHLVLRTVIESGIEGKEALASMIQFSGFADMEGEALFILIKDDKMSGIQKTFILEKFENIDMIITGLRLCNIKGRNRTYIIEYMLNRYNQDVLKGWRNSLTDLLNEDKTIGVRTKKALAKRIRNGNARVFRVDRVLL